MKYRLAVVFTLAALLLPAMANAQTDPGQRAFLQCRACHSLKANEPNKTGPNLNRMFGGKAGSIRKDYKYSGALTASGIVWSEATLDAWLTNPAAMVKGNRMAFAGMPNPQARKALIVWLKRETR